ncbi:patatin-like phospholipase family protein [Glutamicibacter sp.]|uniref:patatin-like phospholipase family protein n=1 Tax=Glutamicibacter sp. TaxID=1931995 RepID=UPI0028BE82AE|nr:patatin-like phospholipase family protein [Glutamicibacter sp.]
MKRSLVLAGGGMRVAWQAGVLKALEESELEFSHVDGTSGGILNTAMMLSGQNADQMIEHWSKVKVSNFSAPLPIRDYLRGPWNLPALSGPAAMVDKLFPSMGVDVEAIRTSKVLGTFNIANFTEKRSITVSSKDVDLPLLAAGMSLPIFTAPLHRDGLTWTDAAWIRDANITAALDHDAEEIWLIWCVGNSPYWGNGPLEQYVHMIEMSATGGLMADFELAKAAGREFVLHVVKPEHPLPLDPVFYLGRISSSTLMSMGYRDAVAYLEQAKQSGVLPDYRCTAMTDETAGASWSERLSGRGFEARMTIWSPLDPSEPGTVTGFLSSKHWKHPIPLAAGSITRSSGRWVYRAKLRVDGSWAPLVISRKIPDRSSIYEQLSHATMEFGNQRISMRLGLCGRIRMLLSLEPFGAHGVRQRISTVKKTLKMLRTSGT